MFSFRPLAVALVVCVAAGSAWPQEMRCAVPAASVAEPFSVYQRQLNDAADALLATQGNKSEMKLPTADPGSATFDEQALRRFAQQYWNGEEQNARRALERVAQLSPMLEAILAEERVPKNLVAIALVESGGQPAALSPKGARGVWQFMPETARRYGLAVSDARDERLDVAKSTRAAARYLRELHAQFGDWQLAFAAYNAGGQAVSQAVARAGDRNFSRIQTWLPRETRSYVPAVMGAMALFGSTSGMATPTGESTPGAAHWVYAPAEKVIPGRARTDSPGPEP